MSTSPSPNLADRTALVTGAASGIGLAIARNLANHGVSLVLVDLPSDGLMSLADELAARPVPTDLSRRQELAALAAMADEVDILVNNAGLQHVSPVHEFPPEKWDLIIAVMLTAPYLLARASLHGMYRRGWSRVVNIASVHGLRASANKSAYVAAKHGLVGLTKTIALEAAERASDVTAHAICPSYVRTPMVENQIADQARVTGLPEDQVLERVLLTRNAVRRLISTEDVADAVTLLCGESAWTMTGSVLTLDAGWLAH
jgi:3-hydroxybutyrate dehydrogenase